MPSLREFYESVCQTADSVEQASAQVVQIQPDDVAEAMRQHSEAYRFWSQLWVIARDEATRMKDHVREVVLADCKARARQEIKSAGERPTDSRVDETAKRDPAYQRSQAAQRDAELKSDLLKETAEALSQRKDMLQSLNSRQCRELSTFSDRS